ncbi:MAG TPA: alcohol dehydrogenase, partial [Sphingomicrobium sp.]|nr:alcohol dehydrogenase [Sphingomicrobium sp.]
MRSFTFHPGPRLIAGAGKSTIIADLLPEGPVLFVTDEQLVGLGLVDSCLRALEASAQPATVFDHVEADPS